MKIELNKIYKKGCGEICLFQNMSTILANNYKVSFVRKTHTHYVSFYSKTIKKRVRREISDLWIIMYSTRLNIAKMTFLQAKFHKSKIYSPFRFRGEYFQYELLSTRPDIKNAGKKFGFPCNILSYTDNESIGTFGVFYFDDNNEIDLAFCVASLLKPDKAGIDNEQTSVSLVFPPVNYKSCLIKLNRNCGIDTLATLNINSFVQSILKLRIGAELKRKSPLLSALGGILRTSSAENEPAVNEFLRFFDIHPDELPENSKVIPNIMIINVDNQ